MSISPIQNILKIGRDRPKTTTSAISTISGKKILLCVAKVFAPLQYIVFIDFIVVSQRAEIHWLAKMFVKVLAKNWYKEGNQIKSVLDSILKSSLNWFYSKLQGNWPPVHLFKQNWTFLSKINMISSWLCIL